MAKTGLYKRTLSSGTWEIRLDVDGNHPQNKASITLVSNNAHWVIGVLVPQKAVQAEKERLAQDSFNQSVGRTLAFGGSKTQPRVNDVLRELIDRYPSAKAARHAAIAVNMPSAGTYKLLDFDDAGRGQLAEHKADKTASAP